MSSHLSDLRASVSLWFNRLIRPFRRNRADHEMAEEMRAHLEAQIERNHAAGMRPADARAAARRQFGGVAQLEERCREQRGGAWLDHLGRDLRHSGRMIGKTPLLSTVIVFSLAIGIGVNAVVFSWIRALVFRPLPGVENASEVFLIEPKSESGSYPGASWLEYLDLQERLPAFREVLAHQMIPLAFGEPGQEERLYSQFVSGNYFSALGLRPALGRFLHAEEAAPIGSAPVVVISHGFWQTHFSGSPLVLGEPIRLNGQMLTIVGVGPEGFQGTITGVDFDLWVPATMTPVLMSGSRELENRDARGFQIMGRLRAEISSHQAQRELDAAMRELAASYPASNAAVGAEVLPFWRSPRGAPRFLFGALAVLQGFTLLVLLVVCANAANLLLARATARRREIGVRLAIGARPGQIVRLMLTESLALGLLASLLGSLLAMWGTNALRAVPLPGGFPFKLQTALDADGLVITALLGGGCAVLFGLAPALLAARTDSQLALRASSPGPGRHRGRRALVAAEVALALLVLAIAGMFLRNFFETRTANPGFKPEGVLLAAYDLTGKGYDNARALALLDHLLGRLRAAPAVEAAAIASWVPLDFHGMPQGGFQLEGRVRSDGGTDRALRINVTPGYFDVIGLPLLAGRDFAPLTDTAHGPQAVVNEEFVRRFLDGAPPLGRRIQRGDGFYEIIGVVRDSLYETFGEPPKPMMYFSYRDRFAPGGQIHVRTHGPEAALAPGLRRMVSEIDPTVSLYDVRTLTDHVEKNLFFRRIPARLFGGLAPLILLLAAIGIYAVVSCAVAQRTVEIGIRMALGASTRRVVREIVRDNMRSVFLGAAPACFLAMVVMMHVHGGVLNLPTLFGVSAILLTVAWFACWLPARRAARIDPMIALRRE